MLLFVERCSFVDELHPVAQHAVHEARLLVYSDGSRISLVLHSRLQMLSWTFRCVTCGFTAPGVLTGSG